jgi:hypothetical protein
VPVTVEEPVLADIFTAWWTKRGGESGATGSSAGSQVVIDALFCRWAETLLIVEIDC